MPSETHAADPRSGLVRDRLVLKDLSLLARHGLFDPEAALGQRFFIDVAVTADLSHAERDDEAAGTISWADLVEVVTQAFTTRRYKLVEAAAAAIARAILVRFDLPPESSSTWI